MSTFGSLSLTHSFYGLVIYLNEWKKTFSSRFVFDWMIQITTIYYRFLSFFPIFFHVPILFSSSTVNDTISGRWWWYIPRTTFLTFTSLFSMIDSWQTNNNGFLKILFPPTKKKIHICSWNDKIFCFLKKKIFKFRLPEKNQQPPGKFKKKNMKIENEKLK